MTNALKAIALAVVLAGSWTSPAAAAMKPQQLLIEFFDDEEYTNMVGQIIVFCDGTRFRSGAYSMYSRETYYDCV